jgi:hypothetical protein
VTLGANWLLVEVYVFICIPRSTKHKQRRCWNFSNLHINELIMIWKYVALGAGAIEFKKNFF